MPNSLQSSAIASPASRRATNPTRPQNPPTPPPAGRGSHKLQSFIHCRTLLPRHHSLPFTGKSVTYVSGTMCYLCLRPLTHVSGRSNGPDRTHPSRKLHRSTDVFLPVFPVSYRPLCGG